MAKVFCRKPEGSAIGVEQLRVLKSTVNIHVAWRMGPPTEVTLAQSLYWLFLRAGLACVRERRPRDQRNSELKMLGGLKNILKLEVCVWKLSKSQSGLNIFWLIDMEKYLWNYSFFSKNIHWTTSCKANMERCSIVKIFISMLQHVNYLHLKSVFALLKVSRNHEKLSVEIALCNPRPSEFKIMRIYQ